MVRELDIVVPSHKKRERIDRFLAHQIEHASRSKVQKAIASGLVNATGLTRGTLIAWAGLEWRFRRPLRPGDTVRARLRVEEARATSRPDRGLVRLRVELLDDRGKILQEGVWTMLVRRRVTA